MLMIMLMNRLKSKLSDYLKVIDLFAGVGGLSLGFVQDGFDIVLANEKDPVIAESYSKNHPGTRMITGDITQLDIDKVFGPYKGKIDVIVGGPPCQGYSQKGKRKSILDERNFLFEYFCKVVEYINPKYFVMENVPQILTSGDGYFKNEILNLFERMGYCTVSDVLCASDFGVPQNRNRAIFIGKKGEKISILPKKVDQKTTIWDAISDLNYLESGEGSFKQPYRDGPQSDYQKMLRSKENVLYNHQCTAHNQTAMRRMGMIPPGCGREMLPPEEMTKSIYSGVYSRMNAHGQSVTITTRFDTPSSGEFIHPFLNRCITPREAARLQSFPDDFIFYGSKSSQMKQIGNAVPPLLGKAIADSILIDNINDEMNHMDENHTIKSINLETR